jgi:hypothetical protein
MAGLPSTTATIFEQGGVRKFQKFRILKLCA